MKLYQEAQQEMLDRLIAIVGKSHEPLEKNNVTIGVLLVREEGDKPQPCLKLHGHPAIAIVSLTPIKHRAKGAPDALIEIDGVCWDDLCETEQDAVLDHELTHLELVLADGGSPKRDGCGRPKLRIRLHDHEYGWFHQIALRHGPASQEVQQYRALYEERHQQWFSFAGDRKGPAKPRGKAKRGGSFKDQMDALMDEVAKETGSRIERDVVIPVHAKKKTTTRRRAAQK